jgi:hypothetical protein
MPNIYLFIYQIFHSNSTEKIEVLLEKPALTEKKERIIAG